MSRGPGRQQRAVLAAVQAAVDENGFPQWVSVEDLPDELEWFDTSERESRRRAMRTLARAGLVEKGTKRVGPQQGRIAADLLAVRLPLTEAQEAQEQEEWDEAWRRCL